MSAPSIPEGYTSFPEVMRLLFLYQSNWKPQTFSLTAALASFPVPDDDPVGAFTVLGRWKMDRSALQNVRNHLGHCLASEKVRSVGVSKISGELHWIPGAAWRLMSYKGPNRSATPVIEAVFDNDWISVRNKHGGMSSYYPLISYRELATAFNAESPPHEPVLQPTETPPRATVTQAAEPTLANVSSETSTTGQVTQRQPNNMPEAQVERVKHLNRGGRPAAHDWEAFWIEVACWAAKNDLESEYRPDLRKHMLAWFAERSSAPPDASTVDRKLSALYAEVVRKT